jgi:cbb3-type cytochrome oxidase subunit 3
LYWLEHRSVVLVLAGFVLAALAAYWPGRRPAIEQHGLIPLNDDEGGPRHAD